ncbi:RagB/SusD family nutrient uptake outer membrane protein [Sphingobacterium tabacisoli]|uniref:RagB/SusD family nutrient uptake outer membrane protein n=1 Tax=Sphingobacterium tabacisoli TaxID=2044855 RepID=A0ABW5L559_9SPHI|nr:RagB/SusD family nutrient uptake outer membrane protein [Sphingobacterium tabacisoli]
MKKSAYIYIIKISFLFTALYLFGSCKKLIEIPGNPPTFITKEQQFADSATAMSAVVGAYSYSQGKGFGYSDANFTVATGLSADEISVTASNTDYTHFYNYMLTPLSGGIVSLWQYPYQGVYKVNDILEGVSHSKGLSQSFIRQISGEMKVLRALYYFNMVNIFGGVPLVTSTDYQHTARFPRTSVDEVYRQVIQDLEEAVIDLSPDYPSSGRQRPNLYTAKALLSKVFLYRGNWKEAYDAADDVIKSGIYSISDVAVDAAFLEGSDEAIWQLPVKNSYRQTDDAQTFVPSAGVLPKYLVTPFLLNQFEKSDQRLQHWVGVSIVKGDSFYYPFKYKNKQASSLPLENLMIVRLGEVLLIRAEAAAHLHNLEQAVKDLDVIRRRAGLENSIIDKTSQQVVLNAIMKERQLELCFEWGNRWFDLKRNVTIESSASTVLGDEKAGYTSDAALYPIPQGQRQLNNLLEQNPGYN